MSIRFVPVGNEKHTGAIEVGDAKVRVGTCHFDSFRVRVVLNTLVANDGEPISIASDSGGEEP